MGFDKGYYTSKLPYVFLELGWKLKQDWITQNAPLVLWTNSKLRLGLPSVPARVARFGIGGACGLIKKQEAYQLLKGVVGRAQQLKPSRQILPLSMAQLMSAMRFFAPVFAKILLT
jgi:hypothetical protein